MRGVASHPVGISCSFKFTRVSITHPPPYDTPMTSSLTSSEIPITQPYPDVIVDLRGLGLELGVRVRIRARARVTRRTTLVT